MGIRMTGRIAVMSSPLRAFLGRLVLGLVPVLVAGCACSEEDLPLTRNLATVHNTVDFARYVARERCWEHVYDLLSKATREKLAKGDVVREKVERYFRFVEVGDLIPKPPPGYGDMNLSDLIASSEILSFVEDPEAAEAAPVTYVILQHGRLQASVPLVREDGQWRLDVYGLSVQFLPEESHPGETTGAAGSR
jgi:hypothetical protein